MVLSGRESSFVVERTAEQEHHLSERLYDAAARGSEVTVDRLLGEGVNPEWINPEGGLTPLLVATMNGREKCVLSLLRAGADIYATGAQGATALDLFVKLKTLFRLCNKLFRNRNYPAMVLESLRTWRRRTATAGATLPAPRQPCAKPQPLAIPSTIYTQAPP